MFVTLHFAAVTCIYSVSAKVSLLYLSVTFDNFGRNIAEHVVCLMIVYFLT